MATKRANQILERHLRLLDRIRVRQGFVVDVNLDDVFLQIFRIISTAQIRRLVRERIVDLIAIALERVIGILVLGVVSLKAVLIALEWTPRQAFLCRIVACYKK